VNFVVLSSSHGTTFQAILDRIADGKLTARLLGLVSDREDRGCTEKARRANVPVVVVEQKGEETGEQYDARLDAAVRSLGGVDVIAAIGWMYILTPEFIRKWRGRILNVHPALLPKYGGRGLFGMRVHEAVLNAGEKKSGMTIHLMDEDVDTGPILVQKTCSVFPRDTPEKLRARVQDLEKEWYPKVLEMINRDELQLPFNVPHPL